MKSINDVLFEKKKTLDLKSIVGGCHTTRHEGTEGQNGHIHCDHSPDECTIVAMY